MSSLGGYIKIHRRILEWEWYGDNVVRSVFLHLLVKASFKDNRWQGEKVYPGQVITGAQKIADDLGFSRQQIRTALKKLQSTGEITIKATNKYSVITIAKWEDYQIHDQQSGSIQSAFNQPHLKKDNNVNNVKKIYGAYKNVALTLEEYEKLKAEFTNADEAIEYLSEYIEYKGYKVKSHYLALRRWVFSALAEKKDKPTRGLRNFHSDSTYDFDEIEKRAMEKRMAGML